MAVEFRDEDTGAHTDRIGHFSARLARAVGKVAVPDSVLLKAGPLTDSERASMQTHARTGHRLLGGSSSALLDLATSIALSHHEKWDGSGLSARTRRRRDPDRRPDRRDRRRLRRVGHFDPQLLDIFLNLVADEHSTDAPPDPHSGRAVSAERAKGLEPRRQAAPAVKLTAAGSATMAFAVSIRLRPLDLAA
jgi:HD-GYP domain-containing protein (c-di-GMP phosphodiesterase class II)